MRNAATTVLHSYKSEYKKFLDILTAADECQQWDGEVIQLVRLSMCLRLYMHREKTYNYIEKSMRIITIIRKNAIETEHADKSDKTKNEGCKLAMTTIRICYKTVTVWTLIDARPF